MKERKRRQKIETNKSKLKKERVDRILAGYQNKTQEVERENINRVRSNGREGEGKQKSRVGGQKRRPNNLCLNGGKIVQGLRGPKCGTRRNTLH